MQTVLRLFAGLAFRQDAPADRDDRVGGDEIGADQLGLLVLDLVRGLRLAGRQALREKAGRLAALRSLVDLGRKQRVDLEPRLLQEREAPGRGGGEHEPGARGNGLRCHGLCAPR